VREQFDGDLRMRFHLAPPLLSKRNDRGELVKRTWGPWIFTAFRVLARLRGLRGTALDVFGYTEERRMERRLIEEYESMVRAMLPDLDLQRRDLAVALVSFPDQIRGFGHVKERNVKTALAARDEALGRWRASATGVSVTAPALQGA